MHRSVPALRRCRAPVGGKIAHVRIGAEYLIQYWPQLHTAPNSMVFVPLCGKSRDMLWLRKQGNPVLVAELHTIFDQRKIDPLVEIHRARETTVCHPSQILNP